MSIQILIIKLQNKKSTSERLKKYISKIHVKIAVKEENRKSTMLDMSYLTHLNNASITKVVNITQVMIKLQFKLPQALISRGFTRRTVFHAPAFQQKGINRFMDIYQIWKP